MAAIYGTNVTRPSRRFRAAMEPMDLQHDPKNLQRVLHFTAERSEPGGKRDRTERSSAGASRRDHGERGQSQPVAVFGCADDGLDEWCEKRVELQ
jgi:hypothetical protein